MRARNQVLVSIGIVLFAVACGPANRDNGDDCAGICTSFGYQACNGDGTFADPVACGPDELCDPTRGCIVCVPDSLYCWGPTDNDVYQCNGEGTAGEYVESCGPDEVCSGGQCKTPCEAALDHPSNIGCDFWAADLDNEASSVGANAAAQPMAIVVANNNDYPVTVTVTKNAARVGEPVQEQVVTTVSVPPRSPQRIDLPQREVDGAQGQNGPYVRNGGSGTFVSPHAYHVVTSGPVVVYQFNPIIQQFSNDASTLIPIQALGTDYIAVGFETANPCGIDGIPGIEGIPDHGAITIIAPQDDTFVTVTTSHTIMASGGDSGFSIPMTPKNGQVSFKLGRYTVVNLETQMYQGSILGCTGAVNGGQNGDFTGSYIKADKPIVVFTSSERGLGFGGAPNVDYPPDWDMANDDICCTEHLEEQLLPVTAHGKEYVVARSPIRSTYPSWVEQDIYRVVGSADDTTVTTNLAPPFDTFKLNAREQKTFMARTGFTIKSDKAIQVAQYLVAQQFIKQGFIGDPDQMIIPAAEQHRKDYVFLVPSTFQKNYVVFAKPVAGANIKLDGISLESQEFGDCVKAPIGMVQNIMYEQMTCPLIDGRHVASGDLPFGLSVYGYYSVGSYSFSAGSDVKIINPIF